MAQTIDRAPYFGQVEPNHLSAQRNGQIYGQLKADDDINVLENGQFVFYDYAKGKVIVNPAKASDQNMERFMVFNEVKLYKDFWQESYKDFAMQRKDFTTEGMTPRVIKTNVGDLMTTTTVAADSYEIGDVLTPGADGILAKGTGAMEWTVVKSISGSDINTMPDGTPAVKLQRTK